MYIIVYRKGYLDESNSFIFTTNKFSRYNYKLYSHPAKAISDLIKFGATTTPSNISKQYLSVVKYDNFLEYCNRFSSILNFLTGAYYLWFKKALKCDSKNVQVSQR